MWTSMLWSAVGASLLGSSQCFTQPSQLQSRQQERATAPQSANMTKESPQFFPNHNSERVKIRYGPFTVPEMSVNNAMKDFTVPVAEKPCTDCLVTWIQAGLEYPNGTVANANNGLWLHHTVFSNTQRTSIICPQGGGGDQFFASGNERTPIDLCVNGTDQAGYYIGPNDNIGFLVELMNMVEYSREAVLTMTWEYIPSVPSGFDKLKPLWLDIGGCGSSEVAAKTNPVFQYTDTAPWTSNFTGRITTMAGHLHDGGTHLTITKNNAVLCDCVAAYGQSAAYVDGGSASMSSSMSGMSMQPRAATSMAGMSMGVSMSTSSMMDISESSVPKTTKTASSMVGMSMGTSTSMHKSTSTSTSMAGMNMGSDTVHISSISTCNNLGTVGVGDVFSVTAYYNATEHPLMTNTDGSLAPIMGIALVYVADLNMKTTVANSTFDGVTGTGAPSASASSSYGVRGFGPQGLAVVLGCGLLLSMLVVV